MTSTRLLTLFWLAGIVAACDGTAHGIGTTGPDDNGQTPPSTFQLALQTVVAPSAGLVDPVYVTSPPGDARLFIVEKRGLIRIFQNNTLVSTPFLDISSRVSGGDEQGLLSLAFHPQYATNGRFYVFFTDSNDDLRVEQFSVNSSTPNVASSTPQPIITIPHPSVSNHNGGLVMFGPDGMLYIGTGDGGNTPATAQNRTSLLGKILRLDVNSGTPYAIPASNPFASETGSIRKEIWAYGLRNPWRYAFDGTTSRLYVADVGQNTYEEINVVSSTQAGVNFGWDVMEGAFCYNAATCTQTGMQLPAFVYDHSDGRCSITGGFVYRGTALPEIAGHYFYADFCIGGLRSVRYVGPGVTDQITWNVGATGNVLSFGQDASGELYLTSNNGSVYKIVRGS